MNSIVISGNLVADPVLGTSANGSNYCRVAIGTTVFSGKEKKSLYINILAFDAIAKNLCQYCNKGTKVIVQGELDQNTYEDKNGSKQNQLYIKVRSLEFESSGKASAPTNTNSGLTPMVDDDLPF